jgi:hypothetical protein
MSSVMGLGCSVRDMQQRGEAGSTVRGYRGGSLQLGNVSLSMEAVAMVVELTGMCPYLFDFRECYTIVATLLFCYGLTTVSRFRPSSCPLSRRSTSGRFK